MVNPSRVSSTLTSSSLKPGSSAQTLICSSFSKIAIDGDHTVIGEILVPSKNRAMPSVNRRMSSEGLAVRRARSVRENKDAVPPCATPRSHALACHCPCPCSPLSCCLLLMITSAMVAFSFALLEHVRYQFIPSDASAHALLPHAKAVRFPGV